MKEYILIEKEEALNMLTFMSKVKDNTKNETIKDISQVYINILLESIFLSPYKLSTIETAFENMKAMGWNIENYHATLHHHLTTLKELSESNEDTNIKYMSQFISDFIESI